MPFIPDAAPSSNFVPDDQQPREGHGVWDALVSGYQSSATGLAIRGRLPDVQLDPEHSKWYERAAQSAAQMGSEAPEMVGGFMAGAAAGTAVAPGPGTVVGAGAGTMAVPTAIRESLVQAYSKGDASSSGDFLSRAAIVLKETAKSALVGGLTAGAGMVAARGAGSVLAPMVGESITAQTAMRGIGAAGAAAEIGTMGLAPAALDGRLPEPKDFADAAILVAGMHAAAGVAGKIADVYAKTGRTPEQIVGDVGQNPEIAQQFKDAPDGQIPDAYRPLAARQAASDAVPNTPGHELDVAAFLAKPEGAVPDEKTPNYINYQYMTDPDAVKAVDARVSEIAENYFQQARGGAVSMESQREVASRMIADWQRETGQAVGIPRDPREFAQLAGKVIANKVMTRQAALDLKTAADAITQGGASPESVAALSKAFAVAKAIKAVRLGNEADIARAMRAMQDTEQTNALTDQLLGTERMLDRDPARVAQMIQKLGDPDRIAKFGENIDKATTLDKLQQYYRFALLTGPTVYQVKALGDAMATGERVVNAFLRIPSSVIGSGETASRVQEFSAMVGAMRQGVRDGVKAMVDTWKATAEPRAVFGDGKANILDKVTNIPHRIIESETELFRVLNERMEMSRVANEMAMREKFRPGTPDFAQRINLLMQNPTDEMVEASQAAGDEATFTNKTTGLGKLLTDVSNNKYGKWGGFLVPFAKVPANLATWAIKDTPGLGLLMQSNRDAWAAGGAARDGVIARQVIGGTVALSVAAAVSGGTMTGGGLSLSPEQRDARRASEIPDYSFKVGNTWYSYERFQPLGTIAMWAADMMEMVHESEVKYRADTLALTGTVLGHSIVSTPYFEGIHQMMEALTNAKQTERMFDGFTGAFIPSFLAQAASSHDPDKRRVDGFMDAMQQRIPIWREQLLPKINPLTGEAVPNPRGMGLVATETDHQDPVLEEAARLEINLPPTPKSLSLPAKGDKKLGKVALTPEQQNTITEVAGKQIHDTMTQIVTSDAWKEAPDQVKRNIFQKVISEGRKAGRAEALSPEQREAESARIAAELEAEMRNPTFNR